MQKSVMEEKRSLRHHRFYRLVNPRIVFALITAVVFIAAVTKPGYAQGMATQKPDLGGNVLIFDPTMPRDTMQQQIDKIYAIERRNEFGAERYAMLFLPGEYHLDVPVASTRRLLGSARPPTRCTLSATCMPMRVMTTIMPRPPSGAMLKVFPSPQRAEPCNGPYRRPFHFGVCIFTET